MNYFIVTGANKGIGLALVETILRENEDCSVVLCSRDQTRGERAVEKLLAQSEGWKSRLESRKLDVASKASVSVFAEWLATLPAGCIAGLVNNAGIASGTSEEIMRVNVYGVHAVTEVVLPRLTNGARVVNVASASGPNYVSACSPEWQRFFTSRETQWRDIDGFAKRLPGMTRQEQELDGLPAGEFYGASKACVNIYTMQLAQRHPELCINACTPGFIETDLTRQMFANSGRRIEDAGLKKPHEGVGAIMRLLFDPLISSGNYYGSDSLRSPIDRYRAPGSPEFEG